MPARSGVARAAVLTAGAALAIFPAVALATDLTIDDRDLKPTGSWSKVSAPTANAKTLSKSKKKGAVLATKTDAKSGGSVVFQVGAGRGTATISVGGKKQATVPTSARKKKLKTVTFKGSGAVKITVTKQGGGVYVDAITLNGIVPPGGTSNPGSTPGGTPGATPTPGPGTPAPLPANLGPLSQVDVNPSTGAGGNGGDVTAVSVSPNGKMIAFWSQATNLVDGVTDGYWHLYVKVLATGQIGIADAAQNGTLSNDNSSSSGARAIAWKPDSNEILFTSSATNLGPSTSGLTAPFLYSKQLDDDSVGILAERASIDAAWSPDGSKIVYGSTGDYCFPVQSPCTSTSDTHVKLYVLDLASGNHIPISARQNGAQPQPNGGPNDSTHPVWSPDSSKIAFESDSPQLVDGDSNVASDIFVKNLADRSIARVSTTAAGAQANNASEWPAFSPDGTKLAFDSRADNLAPGDNNSGSDVFVKDLGGGGVSAISVTPAGEFKLFEHRIPKWSPDGTRIAFNSKSVDLIDGFLDNNQREDIYVKTLATSRFQLISVRSDGVLGGGDSTLWNVTGSSGGWFPDGHSLAFLSRSTNFASSDSNAFSESVFVKAGL